MRINKVWSVLLILIFVVSVCLNIYLIVGGFYQERESSEVNKQMRNDETVDSNDGETVVYEKGDPEVYRPREGDIFYYGEGEFLTAEWDTNVIENAYISIVPVSDHLDTNTISFAGDVKGGKLNYALPDNGFVFYPGLYKLEISGLDVKTGKYIGPFYSDVFEIKTKEPILPYKEGDTYIKSIKKGEGANGQKIVYVDARSPDDQPLSPYGLWSSYLWVVEDADSVVDMDGKIEGKYNYDLNLWAYDISDFVFNNFDSYQVSVECYAFYTYSICGQEYGNRSDHGKIIERFNLSDL